MDKVTGKVDSRIEAAGQVAKDGLGATIHVGASAAKASVRPLAMLANEMVKLVENEVNELGAATDVAVHDMSDDMDGMVYRDFHTALEDFEEKYNQALVNFLVAYGKFRTDLSEFGEKSGEALVKMSYAVGPALEKTSSEVGHRFGYALHTTEEFETDVRSATVLTVGLSQASTEKVVKVLTEANEVLQKVMLQADKVVEVIESTVRSLAVVVRGEQAVSDREADNLLESVQQRTVSTLHKFHSIVSSLVETLSRSSGQLIQAATREQAETAARDATAVGAPRPSDAARPA